MHVSHKLYTKNKNFLLDYCFYFVGFGIVVFLMNTIKVSHSLPFCGNAEKFRKYNCMRSYKRKCRQSMSAYDD